MMRVLRVASSNPSAPPSTAENLISEHGQEWLLNNKYLADQFLDDCDRIESEKHHEDVLDAEHRNAGVRLPVLTADMRTSSNSSRIMLNKDDRYARLFDEDLYSNCTYPLWPDGWSGVLPVLLWSWAIFYGVYSYPTVENSDISIGVNLVSNPTAVNVWAHRVFYVLLFSHSVEAVLVWLWLLPVQFTLWCRVSWCWYSFVCGWPCSGRAKILCQIALTKKEQRRMATKLKKEKEKYK